MAEVTPLELGTSKQLETDHSGQEVIDELFCTPMDIKGILWMPHQMETVITTMY